jgi:hypothetical protein
MAPRRRVGSLQQQLAKSEAALGKLRTPPEPSNLSKFHHGLRDAEGRDVQPDGSNVYMMFQGAQPPYIARNTKATQTEAMKGGAHEMNDQVRAHLAAMKEAKGDGDPAALEAELIYYKTKYAADMARFEQRIAELESTEPGKTIGALQGRIETMRHTSIEILSLMSAGTFENMRNECVSHRPTHWCERHMRCDGDSLPSSPWHSNSPPSGCCCRYGCVVNFELSPHEVNLIGTAIAERNGHGLGGGNAIDPAVLTKLGIDDADGLIAHMHSIEAASERKDWAIVGAVLDGVCAAVAESAAANEQLDAASAHTDQAVAAAVAEAVAVERATADEQMAVARSEFADEMERASEAFEVEAARRVAEATLRADTEAEVLAEEMRKCEDNVDAMYDVVEDAQEEARIAAGRANATLEASASDAQIAASQLQAAREKLTQSQAENALLLDEVTDCLTSQHPHSLSASPTHPFASLPARRPPLVSFNLALYTPVP